MTSLNQKSPLTPPVLSVRLVAARDRLRLTQVEVAKRTGIGESTLSEFENGKREPSLSQLQALTAVYQRSLSWLLGEAEDPTAEVVLWRDRPRVEVAAEIGARFLRLCERFRNLELWSHDVNECELPWEMEPHSGGLRSFDAAALAKQVRSALALGDRPGESLLRTLEEACGVKIFHLEFEPTGTAACSRSPSFGASILLNKKNVPWRRTFDTAHELFHLLTWRAFQSSWSGTPPVASEREEQLANIFASSLLLPEESFRLAVQRRASGTLLSNLDHAYSVAREFGVSVEAVIVRAKFLFSLPEEQATALRNEWRVHGPSYEDRSRECPSELPDRFMALAHAALRNGDISIGKFAEYTEMSRQRALDLARRQDDFGEDTPAPTPA
jgi:Zn-dependent peptidase ImmA (M78 family)/DNA-binding XRE family transcriptional regulator